MITLKPLARLEVLRIEVFDFIMENFFKLRYAVNALCYLENDIYITHVELDDLSRMRIASMYLLKFNDVVCEIEIHDKQLVPNKESIEDSQMYTHSIKLPARRRTFLKNYDFTNGDFGEFMKALIHEKPMEALRYGKMYEENFRKYIPRIMDNSPFEYQFPKHMIDYINLGKENVENQRLWNVFYILKKWYDSYCNTDNMLRRKGLMIFSKKRCLGKTEFAYNLVGKCDERYIYNRAKLNANEFIQKINTAKIVILDDIKYDLRNEREMIKALMVSQPTDIKSMYVQYKYNATLPCVMLTNNEYIFKMMGKLEEFQTACYLVSVEDYIGPPGTEPVDRDEIVTNYDFSK
jgi:hypothetical protein